MQIGIPGFGVLKLEHLVLDYNGTIALDGILKAEVAELLPALAENLRIHVVTADTFGTVRAQLEGFPVEVVILKSGDHTSEKADFVQKLGAEGCAAIGNGNNDRKMLDRAALGIAVLGEEGCATASMEVSDLLLPSIGKALELLLHEKRLIATLRR